MLLVREVMTRGVFSLEANCDLEMAAIALIHRGFSGAPVRDADGTLIGVVSKTDLIEPHPKSWRRRRDITVVDVMTPNIFAVYETDPALHAVKEMSARKTHRLIVHDREGQPVGIITSMDVVRSLAAGAAFSVADA